MQSIFLACYLCLQLINSPDPTILQERDKSCDQCLTTFVEKLYLPSDVTTQIEDFLSIRKPATEIVSENPALALTDAISNIIKEEITPISDIPTETQEEQGQVFMRKVVESLTQPKPKGKSSLKVGERLMAGESLVSENKKYLSTLNNHGPFIVTRADGKFLEKISYRIPEASPDFNVMVYQDNSVGYYETIEADPNNYVYSIAYSVFCNLADVKCYLNLDDDGVMRLYSGDGVYENTYSTQPCHRNTTLESQQENSEEVEYKGKSTLKRNERLLVGASLVSENGKFKMTLNHYGSLVIVDSRGKVIKERDTCSRNLPYSDRWNIFMDPDNGWGLFPTVERGFPYFTEAIDIPWGCKLPGVECYLKLDNDGILQLFNNQGPVEMEYLSFLLMIRVGIIYEPFDKDYS